MCGGGAGEEDGELPDGQGPGCPSGLDVVACYLHSLLSSLIDKPASEWGLQEARGAWTQGDGRRGMDQGTRKLI